MAGQPVRVLGDSVQPGTAVRVSGFLALDCHGAFGDCAEDNHNDNNVELHPVYAVDVLRDPGVSPTELTGVWHCSDVGTYYVRQIGQTVWWLGMSRDRGHTFANVFRGTLQGAALSGSWADVPLSSARSAGVLALDARSGASATALHRMSATGGFGGATWEKIRD
jgi:hypothetical protein